MAQLAPLRRSWSGSFTPIISWLHYADLPLAPLGRSRIGSIEAVGDTTESFDFPDLSDEAVIAINELIEEFYVRFQNHYFAQMHRFDRDQPIPDRDHDQMPLPLDNPPF